MSPASEPIDDGTAQRLLNRAAAELEAKHPKNMAWIEFYGVPVIARVAWCGVVVVTDRNTGKLLARSKPGQPTELDKRR